MGFFVKHCNVDELCNHKQETNREIQFTFINKI